MSMDMCVGKIGEFIVIWSPGSSVYGGPTIVVGYIHIGTRLNQALKHLGKSL